MKNIFLVSRRINPAAEFNVIRKDIIVIDKETKAFFEAIDKHGFKFWVCPNGCKDFVDWDGDKATCRKCGAHNKPFHSDPEKQGR